MAYYPGRRVVYPVLNPRSPRKQITRIIVCIASIICLTLTPIPTLSAEEITDRSVSVSITADEQQLLDLVNNERRENGMGILKSDPKLQLMARDYGREMILNNFFGHVSTVSGDFYKRFSHADVRSDWRLAGENLAISATIENAHVELMKSPDHRSNLIESKYTHIGIGIIEGPCGKVIVQEFATYPQDMQPVAVLQTANELLILTVGWIANIVPTSI